MWDIFTWWVKATQAYLTENFVTKEYKRFIRFCYPTPAVWKQLNYVNREYCVLFIKAAYPIAVSATGNSPCSWKPTLTYIIFWPNQCDPAIQMTIILCMPCESWHLFLGTEQHTYNKWIRTIAAVAGILWRPTFTAVNRWLHFCCLPKWNPGFSLGYIYVDALGIRMYYYFVFLVLLLFCINIHVLTLLFTSLCPR